MIAHHLEVLILLINRCFLNGYYLVIVAKGTVLVKGRKCVEVRANDRGPNCCHPWSVQGWSSPLGHYWSWMRIQRVASNTSTVRRLVGTRWKGRWCAENWALPRPIEVDLIALMLRRAFLGGWRRNSLFERWSCSRKIFYPAVGIAYRFKRHAFNELTRWSGALTFYLFQLLLFEQVGQLKGVCFRKSFHIYYY